MFEKNQKTKSARVGTEWKRGGKQRERAVVLVKIQFVIRRKENKKGGREAGVRPSIEEFFGRGVKKRVEEC